MNNIIFYGWWAMLESSGMPVAKASVLLANISPEQWYIISYRACPHLALEISTNFGNKYSIKESIQKLKGIEFPIKDIEILNDISKDNLDQVKTILQWLEIKKQLSNEFLRYLGIIWAVYEGIVTNEMLPKSPESIAQISEYLFNLIEKKYDVDHIVIGKEYETFIEFCETNSIPWGPEIIRFPEVAQ